MKIAGLNFTEAILLMGRSNHRLHCIYSPMLQFKNYWPGLKQVRCALPHGCVYLTDAVPTTAERSVRVKIQLPPLECLIYA